MGPFSGSGSQEPAVETRAVSLFAPKLRTSKRDAVADTSIAAADANAGTLAITDGVADAPSQPAGKQRTAEDYEKNSFRSFVYT